VLSTTAPLLQSWFAGCSLRNPYPLYAASNAGSFVGLLSYPLIVEPTLALETQRFLWAGGFVLCLCLVGLCGLVSLSVVERGQPEITPSEPSGNTPMSPWLAWRCLGYSALTSSLLVSVTTHLTTDITPMPLLWVVPLGLYLLSFVLVFSGWPGWARQLTGRVVPMFLCFVVVVLLIGANEPIEVVAGIHLVAFFAVTLLCHGELAARRPPPAQLTRFYLLLSLGGVVGGLLTALVAPVVFCRLGEIEYPLALVLVALIRPMGDATATGWKRSDALWAGVVFGLALALVLFAPEIIGRPTESDAPEEFINRLLRDSLSFGVPAVLCFVLVRRPTRFALCLAALLLAGAFAPSKHGVVLETQRNFFGTLRVTRTSDGRLTRMVHGTTQHGQQFTDQVERPQPLMYYHRKGPLGRLFADQLQPKRKVAVVGLGCGAMAAYANPGDTWTFYEINPVVVELAQNANYFTYLKSCPASVEIILGDARRQLEHAPDGEYDLLVLDAFSSDVVPVHLLTREAFALYLRKLAPGGVIAFHLSNRYLELWELVGQLARDADTSLVPMLDFETEVTSAELADGKVPSVWAFVARDLVDYGKRNLRRQRIPPDPGPLWTDDFSNVLSVWRRRN
jgi:SAM-dependent methyltransferase